MEKRQRILDEAEPAVSGNPGLRMCASSRAELDPEELIRFVAAPDGTIVPDLQRRLPGRGVWVRANKVVLARAVAEKVFSKSLKKNIKADPGLPDLVEQLLRRRLVETLALANKAGLVTTGFAQVESLLEGGSTKVLLHCADAALGGREKLDRKFFAISQAAGKPAPIVGLLTASEMSLAMGRENVVHAALVSGGLSERFLGEAERLQRFQSGSSELAPDGGINEIKV